MERSTVDPLILPDQPSREGTPYIIDAGDLPGAEEIFLDEPNAVLDRLSEHSHKLCYTHHFFIRTFINYLMLITLFWRKDSDKNYNG